MSEGEHRALAQAAASELREALTRLAEGRALLGQAEEASPEARDHEDEVTDRDTLVGALSDVGDLVEELEAVEGALEALTPDE
jgi:hypothetical protein